MKLHPLIGAMFQPSHVAIGIARLSDRRFVEVNDAFLALYELRREQVIGHTSVELGLWADPQERTAFFERLVREGSVDAQVARQRTGTGRLRHVLVSANLAEHDGEAHVVGLITDITERQTADAALRESEERFRAFMDNAPTVAWIKDAQGRHVYWSHTLEKRYGRQRADWFGKTDQDMFPPEVVAEWGENDRQVLRTGQPISLTEENLSADGQREYWQGTKFPFTDAAGNAYVAGIALEVTAAKEMERTLREGEERLALALQGSDLGWWDIDVATNRLRIDARFCAILGWPDPERVFSGDDWAPHVHPRDLRRMRMHFAGHSRGDTPTIESEYRLRHAAGHWVWVQLRGRVSQRDAQGRPVRIVGTVLDVSSRRRLSDEGPGLLRRIEALMQEVLAGTAAQGAAAPPPVAEGLTRRQRQILALIAQGYTSAQIAGQLGIATATAVSHRRALMEKLGLHSAAEVTRFALEHRLAP